MSKGCVAPEAFLTEPINCSDSHHMKELRSKLCC